MLIDILQLYGEEFDPSKLAIDVSNQKSFIGIHKDIEPAPLIVLDPLNPEVNTAKNTYKFP